MAEDFQVVMEEPSVLVLPKMDHLLDRYLAVAAVAVVTILRGSPVLVVIVITAALEEAEKTIHREQEVLLRLVALAVIPIQAQPGMALRAE